jgi:hypothetical protein
MADQNTILMEYIHLRGLGMEAKAALSDLKTEISALSKEERDALAKEVRQWESVQSSSKSSTQTQTIAPIKSIAPLKPIAPTETCSNCGKANRAGDLICVSCGQFLGAATTINSTRNLEDDEDYSEEYYAPNSSVVLLVKNTRSPFRIRPQEFNHEVVIGRSADGTIKPDVDLVEHKADELGVSRMHISLTYNAKRHTISATDMDSANGSFINGQRLHPHEVRVLRHGDELRLGKLVLNIYFYNPESVR